MWWKKREKEKRPFISAVIPAAGSSARMGQNKLLLPLDGVPVLVRTLRVFEACPLVDEIVIVCREADLLEYAKLCEAWDIQKASQLVRGGDSRSASVLCGVRVCAAHADWIAIHDGARPLLSRTVLEQTIRDAMTHGAAAPLVPLKSSIKRVKDGFIAGDVPRETVAEVQTPQIFRHADILRALTHAAKQGLSPTDDCAAAELIGIRVFASAGDYTNIKVTTPEDILLAESFGREEA